MIVGTSCILERVRQYLMVLCLGAVCLLSTSSVHAQTFGFGRLGSAVGGVAIDADGTVRAASSEEKSGWLQQLRQSVRKPEGDLAHASPLRYVSLRKLQEQVERAIAEKRTLGEDVLFLAGLQRVEYVFVYPEDQDIVIAGPAEPWTIRPDGSVVGQDSGRPVVRLEDLIVALQTVPKARREPITVSIEPTPEGQQRLQQLLSRVRVGPGFNPTRLEAMMREAFGPQVVKLTTVDPTTRMAAVLVAADYEMKRLAMNLEPSPVKGLPSYMEMVRNRGVSSKTQPRWWMESHYEAIQHSPDKLAWKLSGRGVKAMTEQQYIDANGQFRGTGQADPVAERWAELFTEHFDALCQYNAAFGDVRNVIDLNIIATIIRGHELDQLAGCDLGLLYGQSDTLTLPEYTAPKVVPPHCSFIRGAAGWTVSASGGVALNPWRIVVEKSQSSEQLASVRTRPDDNANRWWWD